MRYPEQLGADDATSRLRELERLKEDERAGLIAPVPKSPYINNHIHTSFSFSPYTPSAAVWCAYRAGLSTAGIMDHDTVAGAEEFLDAGRILSMPVTSGLECRVKFENTPLVGRKINNPDQDTIVYMALHGIPSSQFSRVQDFCLPRVEARNARNRRMTARLNDLLAPFGIALHFDRDVLPLSQYASGGSVTERHICFALAGKMIGAFGKGPSLVAACKEKLCLPVPEKVGALLSDPNNEWYEYDLLGALKAEMVPRFFLPASEECASVEEFVDLGREVGGIVAYAYLGDVGDSATGDKRAQKFEDGYLDELFQVLADLKVQAVTYMPARNTPAQLQRVRALCEKYGMFQICGEDINSPRQKFVCAALAAPENAHLTEAAYALIGHERKSAQGLEFGMFSEDTLRSMPSLDARIAYFARVGRQAY